MLKEENRTYRQWASRGLFYFLLTLIALVMLFPFLYMIIASLKTPSDYQASPRRLLPFTQRFTDYNGQDAPLYLFEVNGEEREVALAKINANSDNKVRYGFFAAQNEFQSVLNSSSHAEGSRAVQPVMEFPLEATLADGSELDLSAPGQIITLSNIDQQVLRNDARDRQRTFETFAVFFNDEQVFTTFEAGDQAPILTYLSGLRGFDNADEITLTNTGREVTLTAGEGQRREDTYMVFELTTGDRTQELLMVARSTIPAFVDLDDPDFALYASFIGAEPSEFIEFQFKNYEAAFNTQNLDRSLVNTSLVTILVVIGQVTTSVFGGYAFSRIQFAGRDTIFVLYLGSIMIPFVVLIVPMFRLMVEMGWRGHLVSLIVPWIFTAYGTFLMRQFFLTIPKELEEAALLDGCGRFRILWQIFVPLSTPAIATQAIFTFLYAWNSFLWPLLIIGTGNKDNAVLTLSLIDLSTRVSSEQPNLLFTGAAVTILPPIFIFILAQKYFVEGIATSGLKG